MSASPRKTRVTSLWVQVFAVGRCDPFRFGEPGQPVRQRQIRFAVFEHRQDQPCCFVLLHEPYFTVDGISQGFDTYYRRVDPTKSNLSVGYYRQDSFGGGVRWGFPIGEKESLSFGVAIDHTTIDTDSTSPYRYQQFVAQNGDANTTLPLTVGWASDSRDSVLYTNKGTLQRANIEVAAPPGDLSSSIV